MKIAYTGTHGTGKTTSVFEHAHKAKMEHPEKRVGIVHENASHAPNGLFNKKATRESQLWIFTNQMQREISVSHQYDIAVCDRTVLDSVAYTIYWGFEELANRMFPLAMLYLQTYDLIIFKSIKNNDYLTKCSHRETTDMEFRQLVEDFLMRLYKKAGITGTGKFRVV